jgi:hypothetical protein
LAASNMTGNSLTKPLIPNGVELNNVVRWQVPPLRLQPTEAGVHTTFGK